MDTKHAKVEELNQDGGNGIKFRIATPNLRKLCFRKAIGGSF